MREAAACHLGAPGHATALPAARSYDADDLPEILDSPPEERTSMTRFGCRSLMLLPLSLVILVATASRARADLWAVSTDILYSRVIRMDNNGNELPGGIPRGLAGIAAPSGIAVAPDGRIFVSSRGQGANTPKILAYVCDANGACGPDINGADFGVFADFGTTAQPAQLRFGADGNLYVSELFGTTVRVYNTATRQRLPDAATNLPGAGGLNFAPNGDLLVGTAATPQPPLPATISRFAGGQPQPPFFVALNGELAFPSSLLYLPNGDLLAVDLFSDPSQIRRFGPDGQDKGAFAVIPPIISGKPSFPSDIEFDPNGNILVAVLGPNNPSDPGGNQGELLRYTLDGTLIGARGEERARANRRPGLDARSEDAGRQLQRRWRRESIGLQQVEGRFRQVCRQRQRGRRESKWRGRRRGLHDLARSSKRRPRFDGRRP